MKKVKLPSDPAAQLRALIAATLKPGASMILCAHDGSCPAGDGHGRAQCTCQPDVYLVTELEQKGGAR